MVTRFLRQRLGIDDLRDQIAALHAAQTARSRSEAEREDGEAAREERLVDAVETRLAARMIEGPELKLAQLDGAVRAHLERLYRRDEVHLQWAKEAAKHMSAINAAMAELTRRLDERDGLHIQWAKDSGKRIATATATLTSMAKRLDERDAAYLGWHRNIVERLAALRQEIVLAHSENVAKRLEQLGQTVRDYLTRLFERDNKHLGLAQQNVQVVASLRETDFLDVSRKIDALDQRVQADLRNRVIRDNARGGSPSPVAEGAPEASTRRFALAGPSSAADLEGLLGLARWLDDDFEAAVALSRITGAALREIFPAGVRQVQTIRCRSGLNLDADMGDIFAASAAFGRLQEADDFDVFMSLVEPGMKIVDVGANFGLYATHAALYAGPEGRVVAFEPGPDAFALLSANASNNGLSERIACVQAAVGAADGAATFNVAADSAFSGLRDTARSPSIGAIEVPLVRLDSVETVRTLGAIDLIKIDVEGAEAGVFAGAHELLAGSPEVIGMFEYSFKNLDEEGSAQLKDQLAWLERTGFAVWTRGPGRRDLTRRPVAELDPAGNENLFFCRPDGDAVERLRARVAALEEPVMSATEAAAISLLKRGAGRPAAGA